MAKELQDMGLMEKWNEALATVSSLARRLHDRAYVSKITKAEGEWTQSKARALQAKISSIPFVSKE